MASRVDWRLCVKSDTSVNNLLVIVGQQSVCLILVLGNQAAARSCIESGFEALEVLTMPYEIVPKQYVSFA